MNAPSAAPVIEALDLSTGHRRHPVGRSIAFAMVPGEVLCLLGPNGSGKTTLFRTLLGLLPAQAGEVRIRGRHIAAWSRTELAHCVGYVPQAHGGMFPYTVTDVVLMGRAARIGRFATPSRDDRRIAAACLADLGIAALADKAYTEISGGERQLALIARALAQQPDLLVMDEPTASLDFGNQIKVLAHIDRLRRQGIAVLMSTHQPEHALRVADRVALLAPGGIVALGRAHETATPARLAALYGVAEHTVSACLPPREATADFFGTSP